MSTGQTQGVKSIFTALFSGPHLVKHSINKRISLQEATALSRSPNDPVFVECNNFEGFKKSCIVAYSSSKNKRSSQGEDWHLGAVLSLHPSLIVIARIKYDSNDGSYTAEEQLESFDKFKGDILKVVYLNKVSESSVAEDGNISSSSSGPCCARISNFGDLNIPDTSKLDKVFELQSCKFAKDNFPFPHMAFQKKRDRSRNKRRASLAHAGMKQVLFPKNEPVVKPSGLLFPGIPLCKAEDDGCKAKFFNFDKSKEKEIISKLNSPNGLSFSDYNSFISRFSTSSVDTRLFTPSENGHVYCPSQGADFEMKVLEEAKEVYELEEDAVMQTIRVEKGTFEVNDSLFPFIVEHTLHGFNFARSCQDSSLGTNFYYGKNQAAYVRPTPNKSKEEIFDHCLWRQSFDPLFAPLLMSFLNQICQQSGQYDAAFDQVGDSLHAKIFQKLGLKLDKWKMAALTILTINFANQAHRDKNDVFGDEFLATAAAVVEECTQNLERPIKKQRNNRLYGFDSKKVVDMGKEAINSHLSRLLHSVEDCSRPTCCGYKVIGELEPDEELFATFTNLSCGVSVKIVNDFYLRFFGAKSVHLTTVPLVINWKTKRIRSIDATDAMIIAWGNGRSARRRFLEGVANSNVAM